MSALAQGVTVVLLHGASGQAATWEPVLPHLAPVDVVAVDLPGRGATPGPALDSVPALASWLAGWLDDARIEAPVVVGHSLGGAIGLQLALDHPARIGALVLVSSAARLRVHPAILAAVAASTPEAPWRLDMGFGPDAPQADKDDYAARSASVPPASALCDWQACDAFDVRARLGEVEVAVLVVHGSRDALTPPRFQRQLAEALPHAEHVEIEGPGHMLPWEAPRELSRAVHAWLDGLAATRP
jgi:pimeloyl-ACP methyl ester carboxylesterase